MSQIANGFRVSARYTLGDELGRGASGRVYAAIDRWLERPVAIKVLHHQGEGPATFERLLREARAAARIEHPGVVKVLDVGFEHGTAFIVMERVSGQSLSQVLQARGKLAVPVALEVASQICDALRAAHLSRVLHRDLKPGNVLLDLADETKPRAKVVDFGIADFMGLEMTTAAARGAGSLPYMAPEQLLGAELDVRTDLYALGCLLYEMLGGRRPFAAATRAELEEAILRDTPAPLELSPELDELERVVARLLDKQRTHRPRDATALGAALRSLSARVRLTVTSASGLRLSIVETLETAAEQARYLAVDGEGTQTFALTRWASSSPAVLTDLERRVERLRSRELGNVMVPEELWSDGAELWLRARLHPSEPSLDYVRQSEGRLRSCLRQLSATVLELHAKGLSLSKLTPRSLRVEAGGQLVLLDLPLLAATGDSERWDRVRSKDLRDLGRVLRRWLTSSPDEPADPADQPEDLESLRGVLRGVPEDLCRSCAALSSSVFAEQLAEAVRLAGASPGAPQATDTFVGREETLATLERLHALSSSAPQLALLSGPSGIGKTALARRFTEGLVRGGSRTLILTSRARDLSEVPFPTLDSAMEGLAAALSERGELDARIVAPRRAAALCRLFPAFARVPALRETSKTEALPLDSIVLRRHAFDALRELLQRVSDRVSLVLVVDDAQWLDEDSAALLRHLLSGDDPPKVLVICAYQTGPQRAASSASFAPPSVDVTHVRLTGLTHAEAETLVTRLLVSTHRASTQVVDVIVSGSQGNPYLLSLVADHVARGGSDIAGGVFAAIRARHAALDPVLARVARTVALCQTPVSRGAVERSLGLTHAVSLTPLIESGLVRVSGPIGAELLEPYHAAVQAALSEGLSQTERRAHHRALAREIRLDVPLNEVALVEHLAASGEWVESTDVAERAAGRAHDQLAFRRAAALYALSLEHHVGSGEGKLRLLLGLAEALANAGRNLSAAEALLEGAALAGDARTESLRRRAGELLLASGCVREGWDVVRAAMSRLELPVPAGLAEALHEFAQTIRALEGSRFAYEERDESDCSRAELERVDLCLSLAQSLSYVDVRFLYFAAKGLLLAVRLGEPRRLQRASALFVAGTSSHLPNPLNAPLLQLCQRLTERLGDPYARVLLLVAQAEVAHFEGRFLSAELACEHAEHLLLQGCAGAFRELADVRIRAVLIQYSQKGDYRSIFERSSSWLEEAVERKDAFYANWLRAAHALVWVARDRPELARAELERAEAGFPSGGGVFEVAVVLYLDVVDRYLGRDDAPLSPAQGRRSVLESPASHTPFLSGYLRLHEGWCSVRAFARALGDGATEPLRPLRDSVLASCDALTGSGLEMWRATADALRGNLAFLEGRRADALAHLELSEARFRQLCMLSLAACARRRRGEFLAGELGKRLLAEADAQLSDLGVVAPAKFAAAYFSMFRANESADRPSADEAATLE